MSEIERVRRQARVVRSQAEVRAGLADMGQTIAAKLHGHNPIVMAVMQGGAFTAVHLCEHFDFPYEFDHVHVGRYGDAVEGGELRWHTRPRLGLAGRSVLLVDDVLDRGVTLRALCLALRDQEPADLSVAVLVHKRIDIPDRVEPDFAAFETDDVFLFGCGMDYKGYWRGLPALYAVHGS